MRTLYRQPSESARHEQLKIFSEEYFFNIKKLMERPSQRYAMRARKALRNLRKAAIERGKELLLLYSSVKNKGKQPITKPQKQNQPKKKIKNEQI